MNWGVLLRDAPVKRKLMFIVLLAAGAALFFATLATSVQQWFTIRTEMVNSVDVQAAIIATSSTAALVFNDPKAAAQTLSALASVSDIELAEIRDKDGKFFASYAAHPQAGYPPLPHWPNGEQHLFGAMYLDVFRPIIFDGAAIGGIRVRSTLLAMYQKMAWQAAVLLAAMLAGLGIAAALIAGLHPAVTRPIENLAKLMNKVSREKNYALREEPYGRDELGSLAEGFNEMLQGIQARDAELAQHRKHLEVEVAQRTADLREANRMLKQLNKVLDKKVKERTQQLLDAQEELVRKEKLAVLGQVAGSVGHELRNPLGVMNNAVYFLQTVFTGADETIKEYLGIIKDEISLADCIVSDLLDAVRTKPPRPETVGVAELIGQTLRKCAVPASVTIKLDIPATIPSISVDAMQIHQVFRNLITNGIEAMPEGGMLEIRAVEDAQAKTVTVSVRDSGSGMNKEHLARLFQPLFTTKARGIGLGLVVVKNLTQANGGSVEVQSEAGKGAIFSVTLPCAATAAETA